MSDLVEDIVVITTEDLDDLEEASCAWGWQEDDGEPCSNPPVWRGIRHGESRLFCDSCRQEMDEIEGRWSAKNTDCRTCRGPWHNTEYFPA